MTPPDPATPSPLEALLKEVEANAHEARTAWQGDAQCATSRNGGKASRLAAIVRVLRDALLAAPCSCQKRGDRVLYGDGYQGYSDVKEDVTCDIHIALALAESIAGREP